MSRISRDERQDMALVAFLETLPEDRLARILTGLGIDQADVDNAARKADPRRCTECGNGYVRCRALDAKNPDLEDRHDWSPDRSRVG